MRESLKVLRVLSIVVLFLTVFGGHALAQSALPKIGGFPPVQNDLARRHWSPTGSPCLAIQGYAKAEAANKDIFQHWIRAANGCGQAIKVHLCYYKTDHCIDMDVPAWEKKEAVLGIFPALKRFQFEAKEKF
jgi:hypothetical protein